MTTTKLLCPICKTRRARKWEGFCGRCLHEEDKREPVSARWGPLDGSLLDLPRESGKVLVVIQQPTGFVTKTVRTVNCGDLPKKLRHDPAVRGFYSRCRKLDDPREFGFWRVKRLSVKEMRSLGYSAGQFGDVVGGKPGWMLNASDIENDGGEQDSADDWKR